MALITSSAQYLPIASRSAHSLPIKLGLTLWSGCQRIVNPRRTSAALSGFSNKPHLRNQQHHSVQSLLRPRRLHCNGQPLLASRVTPLLPNTLIHRTKRFYSEIPGGGRDDSTQSASSNKSSHLGLILLLGAHLVGIFAISHCQKCGAQRFMAQFPDAKIFAEREELQKEEEELKCTLRVFTVIQHCENCKGSFWERLYDIKRKELAEKVAALDRKELEHLRQRAMVLEGKVAKQTASIETNRTIRGSPHEVVQTGILSDKTHTEADYCETAETPLHVHVVGIPAVETMEERPFICSKCTKEKADPSLKQAGISPSANVIPQVPSQRPEAHEKPRTVPQKDDSMAHTKRDIKSSEPPRTKTGPSPVSNADLESLFAENNAKDEEMGQIKQAKDALKSRERELEARGKERKKRVQELNAPKPDQIGSIASGILLGSALAFGATMVMSMCQK